MKKSILIICGLLILISCNKIEDDKFPNHLEVCDIKTEVRAPNGYELDSIGEIKFNGGVESFQFINEETGFAILGNRVGGDVEVFKTVDGGNTWNDMHIESNQSPRNMIFKDENIGIISVYDVTGCPSNCLNKCVILKTEDGGLHWEEKIITDLKGYLIHPQFDSEGNLYAILSLENESTMMKSVDNGDSWDTLFSSAELDHKLVTYSFEMFGDEIFISGEDGKILVINTHGEYIKTMEIGSPYIYDMSIIDKNNIVIVLTNKVIKTINGGETWETIHNENARMIGFDSPNKGFMILGKSFCPTDVYQANDLIASTTDGGLSWIEPDETTTNLGIYFVNSQRMQNGDWYFMIGNKLFKLRK